MEFVSSIPAYAIPFLLVLSILVFVHELGHYLAARFCGVRVEVFSIGFGPEIFGFKDAHGTRWKVCWVPLGGYVQMFGDADPTSSTTDKEKVASLTPQQKNEAFFFKPVWKRAVIVVAGPLINFLYAIIVMAAIFSAEGQAYAPAQIGGLVENGAAAKAGFKINDTILAINGRPIERFQELQREVTVNLASDMVLDVKRGEEHLTLNVKPDIIEQKDNFGFKHVVGRIGIISVGKIAIKEHNALSAIEAAFQETWSMSVATVKAMGQMITGVRSAEELGGVIRIGAYAKEFSDAGWLSLAMFSALISVNLGLINLFPIPLLDGGHLMFYAYEAIFRKPMNERVRNTAIRIGYVFVIALMVFATLNDLIQLKVLDYIAKLAS